MPLFEAIVNSIHAIEECHEDNGLIQITILREKYALHEGEEWLAQMPITGFIVTDNGIGFTDQHFEAFKEADTNHKERLGGKGVGRLLWLKAFERAEISSVFLSDQRWRQREFSFTISNDGVGEYRVNTASIKARQTSVRLLDFQKKYQDKCPKTAQTVCQKIIDHCLEFFLQGQCPTMELIDGEERLVLNQIFSETVLLSKKTETYTLKHHEFRIDHVLVRESPNYRHSFHYCAHMRSVKSRLADELLPELQATVRDENGVPFTYLGYISSEYFDQHVNSERTQFDIDESDQQSLYDEISWTEVENKAKEIVRSFLDPYTEPIKKVKLERIQHYVQSKAPEFRPLVKYCNGWVAEIPPGLSDEKLDLELYKINQKHDAKLHERYQEELAKGDKDALSHEERKKHFESFLQEWNETGMAKLAKHVAYRKATIEFLAHHLKLSGEDNKYAKEASIHQIIFPMGATSDDVKSDDMNLWLIDERLSYHYYLASDKMLRQTEPLDSQDKQRLDLVIFGRPFAFAETLAPFGSITIVEFKRPGRDDYSESDNPVTQVLDYVHAIQSGNAKDRSGKIISIPESMLFYAYILCDITPTLRDIARNRDLTLRSDGQGYFYFNKSLRVHLEIISYDAIIDQAKQRHARFFETLGIGR